MLGEYLHKEINNTADRAQNDCIPFTIGLGPREVKENCGHRNGNAVTI